MELNKDKTFGVQVMQYMQNNPEKYLRSDGTWKMLDAIKDFRSLTLKKTM